MQGILLFHAASDGDTLTIGTLLSSAGAQSWINYQHAKNVHTPLLCAALNVHAADTKQLIEARCNIDLQDNSVGSTTLHFAAIQGHTSVTA